MDVRTEPTSTTLVYLFADQLVPPAKGLMSMAALAPRDGSKVDLKQLVIKSYQAAFIDLVERGSIQLVPTQVKKFLGKETALVPEVVAGQPGPQSGVAGVLYKIIQQTPKPEARRVREIMIRVVGGRSSTSYPWFVALQPVLAEAAQQGWVTLPEKKPGVLKAMFNPTEAMTCSAWVEERVSALATELSGVKARLEAFKQRLGEAAALLRKEIETGVNECMDHSD